MVAAAIMDRTVIKTIKKETQMSRDGMCVIVTGSASGLGAATAAILAQDGARIVINYASSKKEAEETADLCRKAGADDGSRARVT